MALHKPLLQQIWQAWSQNPNRNPNPNSLAASSQPSSSWHCHPRRAGVPPSPLAWLWVQPFSWPGYPWWRAGCLEQNTLLNPRFAPLSFPVWELLPTETGSALPRGQRTGRLRLRLGFLERSLFYRWWGMRLFICSVPLHLEDQIKSSPKQFTDYFRLKSPDLSRLCNPSQSFKILHREEGISQTLTHSFLPIFSFFKEHLKAQLPVQLISGHFWVITCFLNLGVEVTLSSCWDQHQVDSIRNTQNSVKVWQLSLKKTPSQMLEMDEMDPAWNRSNYPQKLAWPRQLSSKKTRSRTLTARHEFHSDYPCQVLHSTVGSIHFSCSQTKIPSL